MSSAAKSVREQVTGVILAGGRATRMGGVDKGLVPINGRPMIAWVIDTLRPQVAEVLINANRNRERYGEFGCPVIDDGDSEFRGPLAGVIADDPTLPDTWSETENIVWKTDIAGLGWSSPVVWDDHIFITAAVSGECVRIPPTAGSAPTLSR